MSNSTVSNSHISSAIFVRLNMSANPSYLHFQVDQRRRCRRRMSIY